MTPPPAPGEAGPARVGPGVPVVDLTLMVRNLYEQAETCRTSAMAADHTARMLRQQADYLDTLAGMLHGLPLPPVAFPE